RFAVRGEPVVTNRREDLLFTAGVAAVLVVLLYFDALNVAADRARVGRPVELWGPMVWEGTSGFFFLAVSPAVTALTRRFWPTRPPWPPKIAVHVLAALLMSLAHVLFIGSARWAIYRMVGGHYDPLGPIGDWPYELRKDVLAYASIVGLYV